MKIDKTENGYIITKEGDELITQNEWSDEIYERYEIELDNVDELFEEFINNGSVVIELNKQEPTLQQLASEPIKDTKVELPKVDLGSIVLDNKTSSTTDETIVEEFSFEEELEVSQTIGEVVTDFINNGWLIEKTRVQRGYATYESLVKFKSNGSYSVIKKRIAGPEIKYLESIIKEMRIGETGANGLPVIQKFIDESKDTTILTVISNEHLIIKYKLRPRAYFKKQQQLAVMCSDF